MPESNRRRLRLTEVTLRGFKAAFEPPPIPLDPFNLLVGRNGSGKSTLIEALQWIDTATRKDIYAACDPFNTFQDIVNKRRTDEGFELGMQLGDDVDRRAVGHQVRVIDDGSKPRVTHDLINVEQNDIKLIPKERVGIHEASIGARIRALSLGFGDIADALAGYWHDAVFLRLIPAHLASGSQGFRKSFDPILDESGRLLPVLLSEVLADPDRRADFLARLTDLLPWVREIEVLGSPATRDRPAYYALHEQVPGAGEAAPWPIPAWMLSEGTRRVAAILALLCRDPAPSLIAIEELENGLDPWTVRGLLRELQSAADRGVQIIATTHSPWVLDDAPPESILSVRRTPGDIVYERFIDRPEVAAYAPSVPMGTRYVNEAV